MENFARRITRPENCALGFGIPTTEDGYRRCLRSSSECFARDFLDPRDASGLRGLADYRMEVIRPCGRIIPEIEKMGVRVVRDLTLAAYSSLFQRPETHAVILFSHWGGDFVEFRDGPAGIRAFIEAVPNDFLGVVDLCVCHPWGLVSQLHRDRPCLIRFGKTQATPALWLYFFRDLFLYLSGGGESYVNASMKLTSEYFKDAQETDRERQSEEEPREVPPR